MKKLILNANTRSGKRVSDSILITGAAGFIGSNLVKAFNERGVDNLILVDFYDKFTSKWKDTLKDVFFQRLYSPEELLKHYTDFNISRVYHIGAISDTMVEDKNQYMKWNYEYTMQLLKVFQDCTLLYSPHALFIFASSSAVYGNGNGPLNMYAMTKLMIDQYIEKNFLEMDKKVFSFRFFNVFGPGEWHKKKMASMIFQLYKEYNNNGTFTIFKDGTQSRDHIYVKDLVRNIIDFDPHIDPQNMESPIIDAGTGITTDFNLLLEYIKKALGTKTKPTYIDMPRRIRETYQVFTKAKPNNQFTFEYDLESAIKDYYNICEKRSFDRIIEEITV